MAKLSYNSKDVVHPLFPLEGTTEYTFNEMSDCLHVHSLPLLAPKTANPYPSDHEREKTSCDLVVK